MSIKGTVARKRAEKNDGLENVLSLKGTARSKVGSNIFRGRKQLSYYEIQDIYNSGGIGAKIITCVADDITSAGFEIDGKDDYTKVMKKFKKLKGSKRLNEAIRWARAYGGGMLVLRINDGRKFDQPLNTKNMKTIERIDTYEAGSSSTVTIWKRYDDTRNPKHGEPEIYMVSDFSGKPVYVHESRTVRIDGRPVDSRTRQLNDGWGGSELQPVYDNLISMFSTFTSGEQVLEELVIGVLRMENLDSLVSTPEGEEQIRKRLDLLDMSKSNENSIAINNTEEYLRHTTALGGIDKIQQNEMLMVSGAADIPATRLYGQSPAGENATGESDEQNYIRKIKAAQEFDVEPELEHILELISMCADVKFDGDMEDSEVIFNPLKDESEYDQARAFEHRARGWKDYIEAGIYSPEEARTQEPAIKKEELIALPEPPEPPTPSETEPTEPEEEDKEDNK